MSNRTLNEWLQYQESFSSGQIKLGLERVRVIWRRLLGEGVAIHCPVVVVGGTNGKGSTVAFLEAIYIQSGYKPLAYTSPHIQRYNERIRIAGREVTDERLIAAFEKIESVSADVDLSYFEFGTLAAFYIASVERPDVLILEVGLGGRLDAVNILEHDVAIITSIAMDHTEFLGDSREKIAAEKMGIARRHRPLILADADVPASLYAQAREIGVQAHYPGQNISVEKHSEHWQCRCQRNIYVNLPYPKMAGGHQLKNAAAAICAADCLAAKLPVQVDGIRSALATVALKGRFDKVSHSPGIYFDVAHNPAAARSLRRTLKAQNVVGKWVAVMALQRNRPIASFVAPLIHQISAWYVAAIANGHSAHDLAAAILKCRPGAKVQAFQRVADALKNAREQVEKRDNIIVLGSFHAVGEANAALRI